MAAEANEKDAPEASVPYHTYTADATLKHFGVSPESGLSEAEAALRLGRYGRNALPDSPPTPIWELILEQFKDQLVLILLGSAVISLALALAEGEYEWTAFVDPAVILSILVLNAVVGISQETSAESAIAALQKYSAQDAHVLRDGQAQIISAELIVPGDIIDLKVGNRVPADCRLVSIGGNSLAVKQDSQTGESVSAQKSVAPVPDVNASLQDKINILFTGTALTAGSCRAVVVETGVNTAMGEIHHSITSQIGEPTPLKQKLDDFGDRLAKVITVICILVWVINIRHFNDGSHGTWIKGAIYYLKIAVSLGVAAIPEGLAVVITTCLALGTRRMAKNNAIVRSLPAVETLGSCNVICSDKTGTITTNAMIVEEIAFIASASRSGSPKFESVKVTGSEFTPEGNLTFSADSDASADSTIVQEIARVSALCNDSKLTFDKAESKFKVIGEPTEGALKVLVEKIRSPEREYNRARPSVKENPSYHSDYYTKAQERAFTYEFSRDRKQMSVLVRDAGSGDSFRGARLLVKGAPERILENSISFLNNADDAERSMDETTKNAILKQVKSYGEGTYRVLALAYKNASNRKGNYDAYKNAKTVDNYMKLEQDLTFIGLVCMLDPPRPDVRKSIEECQRAGIRVIMITGDEKSTAEAVCRKVGIFDDTEDIKGKSFTGRELDEMTEAEKLEAVRNGSLFARTEPRHKENLVKLLQSQGDVVAMTGDGVNDAPALKKADIGVAMRSGTDVAQLASDMVLMNDSFATIRFAIEEGRTIFNNTQQFIRYLISSNIGEVVSIFLTAAIGMPEALIPVQLLWVNLVTDGLPATALSFNPPDNDVMKRPPRGRNEKLVDGWLFFRYMVIGTYVGLATVGGYAWWFMFYEQGPQITFGQLTNFHNCSEKFSEIGCSMFADERSMAASTMSLSILVVIEMFNALNALSSSESLMTLPPWKNMKLIGAICISMALHFAILYVPALQLLFHIVPLNWTEWKAVVNISLPIILIDEVLKFVERKFFMVRLEPSSGKAKAE